MANEADPPNEPDPPDEWRVYEGDDTPDPEPEPTPAPPNVPYGNAPQVPYGQTPTYNPVVVTTSSAGVPKLAFVIIGVVVLAGVGAAAVAIFASVGGGIAGIGSVDPKEPGDFAEMVDDLEEETGSTTVNWVGLYDGYAILDVPYDASDPEDDREISYRWDGGLEEWTKGTATDERFDLADIEPEVIDGMCDPVLEELEDSSRDDCYVFISKPDPTYEKDKWFNALASNDFGQSVNVYYDLEGVEVGRSIP